MIEFLKTAAVTVALFLLAPVAGILLSVAVLAFLLGMPVWLALGGYWRLRRADDGDA